MTLIASQSLRNDGLKGIANVCYPKWAMEALVIANAKRYEKYVVFARFLRFFVMSRGQDKGVNTNICGVSSGCRVVY